MEGKNLLHKFGRKTFPNQDEPITPYCFPDVTLNCPVKAGAAADNGVFSRICFDESGKLLQQSRPSDPGRHKKVKDGEEKIQEDAYRQGFERGERHGLKSVEKRMEPFLKSLKQSIVELETAKKELLLRTEREAVELALAIAKKIVCHEVSVNQEVVLNVLKRALKQTDNYKKIIIKVSPKDLRFLKQGSPQISGFAEDLEEVIEEDKSIMNGGCVIETNLGEIDARIEKQLQTVEEAFRAEIEKQTVGD